MDRCRHCQHPVIWVLVAGERLPLDRDPVRFEAAGLVAYNPDTGGGCLLRSGDLASVGRWKQGGVTLHRRHTATCPNAGKDPDPPGQLTLVGGGS